MADRIPHNRAAGTKSRADFPFKLTTELQVFYERTGPLYGRDSHIRDLLPAGTEVGVAEGWDQEMKMGKNGPPGIWLKVKDESILGQSMPVMAFRDEARDAGVQIRDVPGAIEGEGGLRSRFMCRRGGKKILSVLHYNHDGKIQGLEQCGAQRKQALRRNAQGDVEGPEETPPRVQRPADPQGLSQPPAQPPQEQTPQSAPAPEPTPEVQYPGVDDLIYFNDLALRHGGGGGASRFFPRYKEILKSAIERPARIVFGHVAYPTLPLKAAAMAHTLVTEHAFGDGNHRTTAITLIAFLEINGLALPAATGEWGTEESKELYTQIELLGTRESTLEQFAEYIERVSGATTGDIAAEVEANRAALAETEDQEPPDTPQGDPTEMAGEIEINEPDAPVEEKPPAEEKPLAEDEPPPAGEVSARSRFHARRADGGWKALQTPYGEIQVGTRSWDWLTLLARQHDQALRLSARLSEKDTDDRRQMVKEKVRAAWETWQGWAHDMALSARGPGVSEGMRGNIGSYFIKLSKEESDALGGGSVDIRDVPGAMEGEAGARSRFRARRAARPSCGHIPQFRQLKKRKDNKDLAAIDQPSLTSNKIAAAQPSRGQIPTVDGAGSAGRSRLKKRSNNKDRDLAATAKPYTLSSSFRSRRAPEADAALRASLNKLGAGKWRELTPQELQKGDFSMVEDGHTYPAEGGFILEPAKIFPFNESAGAPEGGRMGLQAVVTQFLDHTWRAEVMFMLLHEEMVPQIDDLQTHDDDAHEIRSIEDVESAKIQAEALLEKHFAAERGTQPTESQEPGAMPGEGGPPLNAGALSAGWSFRRRGQCRLLVYPDKMSRRAGSKINLGPFDPNDDAPADVLAHRSKPMSVEAEDWAALIASHRTKNYDRGVAEKVARALAEEWGIDLSEMMEDLTVNLYDIELVIYRLVDSVVRSERLTPPGPIEGEASVNGRWMSRRAEDFNNFWTNQKEAIEDIVGHALIDALTDIGGLSAAELSGMPDIVWKQIKEIGMDDIAASYSSEAGDEPTIEGLQDWTSDWFTHDTLFWMATAYIENKVMPPASLVEAARQSENWGEEHESFLEAMRRGGLGEQRTGPMEGEGSVNGRRMSRRAEAGTWVEAGVYPEGDETRTLWRLEPVRTVTLPPTHEDEEGNSVQVQLTAYLMKDVVNDQDPENPTPPTWSGSLMVNTSGIWYPYEQGRKIPWTKSEEKAKKMVIDALQLELQLLTMRVEPGAIEGEGSLLSRWKKCATDAISSLFGTRTAVGANELIDFAIRKRLGHEVGDHVEATESSQVLITDDAWEVQKIADEASSYKITEEMGQDLWSSPWKKQEDEYYAPDGGKAWISYELEVYGQEDDDTVHQAMTHLLKSHISITNEPGAIEGEASVRTANLEWEWHLEDEQDDPGAREPGQDDKIKFWETNALEHEGKSWTLSVEYHNGPWEASVHYLVPGERKTVAYDDLGYLEGLDTEEQALAHAQKKAEEMFAPAVLKAQEMPGPMEGEARVHNRVTKRATPRATRATIVSRWAGLKLYNRLKSVGWLDDADSGMIRRAEETKRCPASGHDMVEVPCKHGEAGSDWKCPEEGIQICPHKSELWPPGAQYPDPFDVEKWELESPGAEGVETQDLPPVDSLLRVVKPFTVKTQTNQRVELAPGTMLELVEYGGRGWDDHEWVSIEWGRNSAWLSWGLIGPYVEVAGSTAGGGIEGDRPEMKFQVGDRVRDMYGNVGVVSRAHPDADSLRRQMVRDRKRHEGYGDVFETWLAGQDKQPKNPEGPWYDISVEPRGGVIVAEEFLHRYRGKSDREAAVRRFWQRARLEKSAGNIRISLPARCLSAAPHRVQAAGDEAGELWAVYAEQGGDFIGLFRAQREEGVYSQLVAKYFDQFKEEMQEVTPSAHDDPEGYTQVATSPSDEEVRAYGQDQVREEYQIMPASELKAEDVIERGFQRAPEGIMQAEEGEGPIEGENGDQGNIASFRADFMQKRASNTNGERFGSRLVVDGGVGVSGLRGQFSRRCAHIPGAGPEPRFTDADEAVAWYNGWLKVSPTSPADAERDPEFKWDPVLKTQSEKGDPLYWYVVGTKDAESLVIESAETLLGWVNQYYFHFQKVKGQAAADAIDGRVVVKEIPDLPASTPEAEALRPTVGKMQPSAEDETPPDERESEMREARARAGRAPVPNRKAEILKKAESDRDFQAELNIKAAELAQYLTGRDPLWIGHLFNIVGHGPTQISTIGLYSQRKRGDAWHGDETFGEAQWLVWSTNTHDQGILYLARSNDREGGKVLRKQRTPEGQRLTEEASQIVRDYEADKASHQETGGADDIWIVMWDSGTQYLTAVKGTKEDAWEAAVRSEMSEAEEDLNQEGNDNPSDNDVYVRAEGYAENNGNETHLLRDFNLDYLSDDDKERLKEDLKALGISEESGAMPGEGSARGRWIQRRAEEIKHPYVPAGSVIRIKWEDIPEYEDNFGDEAVDKFQEENSDFSWEGQKYQVGEMVKELLDPYDAESIEEEAKFDEIKERLESLLMTFGETTIAEEFEQVFNDPTYLARRMTPEDVFQSADAERIDFETQTEDDAWRTVLGTEGLPEYEEQVAEAVIHNAYFDKDTNEMVVEIAKQDNPSAQALTALSRIDKWQDEGGGLDGSFEDDIIHMLEQLMGGMAKEANDHMFADAHGPGTSGFDSKYNDMVYDGMRKFEERWNPWLEKLVEGWMAGSKDVPPDPAPIPPEQPPAAPAEPEAAARGMRRRAEVLYDWDILKRIDDGQEGPGEVEWLGGGGFGDTMEVIVAKAKEYGINGSKYSTSGWDSGWSDGVAYELYVHYNGTIESVKGADRDAFNVALGSGPITEDQPGPMEGEGPDRTAGGSRNNQFSNVQAPLPVEAAKILLAAGRAIPDADVYEDPNDPSFGREGDPHVTVKFGLHTDDPQLVRRLLVDEGPIKIRFRKVNVFGGNQGGKYDVLYMEIESPDLERLNKKISDNLEVTDTHPDYKPHATISYVQPGKGPEYADDSVYAEKVRAQLEGKEFEITNLVFSDHKSEKTIIGLTGDQLDSSLSEHGSRTSKPRTISAVLMRAFRRPAAPGLPVRKLARSPLGRWLRRAAKQLGLPFDRIERGRAPALTKDPYQQADKVEEKDQEFDYMIAYSRTTPESAESGDFSDTGVEQEDRGTLIEIAKEADFHYGISFLSRHDGTDWWYSEWSSTDYETGEETEYSLHVKDLTDDQRSELNVLMGGMPLSGPVALDIPGAMEGEVSARDMRRDKSLARFAKKSKKRKKSKGHDERQIVREVDFAGLTISIEFDVGDEKQIKDGVVVYRHPYGEIQDSQTIADGEPVDVYIARHPVHPLEKQDVYVVHQLREDGTYDEDKVLLGFNDMDHAEDCYLMHAPPWGFGSIDRMSWEAFREGYLASNRGAKDMGAEKLPEIKEARAARFARYLSEVELLTGSWNSMSERFRGRRTLRQRAKAFDEQEVRHIAEQVRADAGLVPFGKCGPGMMCQYVSGELVNALRAAGYEARFMDGFLMTDKVMHDWDEETEGSRHAHHAWVQIGDIVVDITGDQFNEYMDEPIPEVYIGQAGERYDRDFLPEASIRSRWMARSAKKKETAEPDVISHIYMSKKDLQGLSMSERFEARRKKRMDYAHDRAIADTMYRALRMPGETGDPGGETAVDRLRPLISLWFESKDGKQRLRPPSDPDEQLKTMERVMKGDFPIQVSRFPELVDSWCTNKGQILEGHSTFNCMDEVILHLCNEKGWKLGDAITVAAMTCERCMNILLEVVTGEPYHGRDTANTHCDICAMVDPAYNEMWLSKDPDSRVTIIQGAPSRLYGMRVRVGAYMPDTEIDKSYEGFQITDIRWHSKSSGTMEVEFPDRETSYDSFIVYPETGKVAFDHWYPDAVYYALAEAIDKKVQEHMSPMPGEGSVCGRWMNRRAEIKNSVLRREVPLMLQALRQGILLPENIVFEKGDTSIDVKNKRTGVHRAITFADDSFWGDFYDQYPGLEERVDAGKVDFYSLTMWTLLEELVDRTVEPMVVHENTVGHVNFALERLMGDDYAFGKAELSVTEKAHQPEQVDKPMEGEGSLAGRWMSRRAIGNRADRRRIMDRAIDGWKRGRHAERFGFSWSPEYIQYGGTRFLTGTPNDFTVHLEKMDTVMVNTVNLILAEFVHGWYFTYIYSDFWLVGPRETPWTSGEKIGDRLRDHSYFIGSPATGGQMSVQFSGGIPQVGHLQPGKEYYESQKQHAITKRLETRQERADTGLYAHNRMIVDVLKQVAEGGGTTEEQEKIWDIAMRKPDYSSHRQHAPGTDPMEAATYLLKGLRGESSGLADEDIGVYDAEYLKEILRREFSYLLPKPVVEDEPMPGEASLSRLWMRRRAKHVMASAVSAAGRAPDYKYDPMPEPPTTLYYGLSRGRLDRVMREGLNNPRLADNMNIARMMADGEVAIFPGEEPVVISITGIGADRLLADDKALKEDPWEIRDHERLRFLLRVRKQFTWADSLEIVGTVRVRGLVNPQEIQVVEGQSVTEASCT